MNQGRYNKAEIEQFTHTALTDSFCVLPNHFPREKMLRWREAFEPLLREHIEREGKLENRGTNRYYVTLPFEGLFADEEIFADPDVLAIVGNLVGKDFTMVQLASDTPLNGSDYQPIHRDAPPLFPEIEQETPMFQLAVNFSLVDITPENGPFEVARRTHNVTKEKGLQMIESGEAPIEQLLLKMGDVMIRDVRHLHRGTPNKTDEPRPMCVIGYSRRWLFRPEVSITIPRAVWETLSPASQKMLRFNRIVESLADAPKEEIYQAFAY
ncbi:MAG TPA: phytanoyl-CoA dioxygenase family protein [Pyrinomonadaceae bacterium]|jgi:ectoine hydroxylase-related dioxygenase (phytanoyl-CoA dioxygenase family)